MNDRISYWLELCDDDLITAKALFDAGRFLHMGFFCHLIAEKGLKAIIVEKTNEIPPRIHDLYKLATQGAVFDSLSEGQFALLDKLTPLQIEARYPEYKGKVEEALSIEYCKLLLAETEDFFMLDKENAREIAIKYAEEVRKVLSPKAIILFGSYANSVPHKDSDIDIAIVFDDFKGNWLETASLLCSLKRRVSIDIEPHIMDEKNDKSGFLEHIVKTGEVIYEAA